MKLLLFILILITFEACSNKIDIIKEKPFKSTSFLDIWTEVKSDPYDKLPQKKVSYFKLSNSNKNIIINDAHRTLNDRSDLLKPFEKLAHPNGICFKGKWKIDKANIYSGYFKNKSEALIIARASTAMSHTTNDSTRAFGFAGKLFPSINPNKKNKQYTANFFLIDDLGGSNSKYYKDVYLSNEPSISITYEVMKNILYAIKVSSAFSDADKHPGIRQLYEISSLDENNTIVTPKWMKIKMSNQSINAKDFRNELKITKGKVLIFDIFVANKKIKNKKEWKKIGNIKLDTSVVSKSCDQRLHFHHAKWKDDLNYGLK